MAYFFAPDIFAMGGIGADGNRWWGKENARQKHLGQKNKDRSWLIFLPQIFLPWGELEQTEIAGGAKKMLGKNIWGKKIRTDHGLFFCPRYFCHGGNWSRRKSLVGQRKCSAKTSGAKK